MRLRSGERTNRGASAPRKDPPATARGAADFQITDRIVVALALCFGPIVAADERRLVRTAAALPMRTALLSWLFIALGNGSDHATGVLLVGPIAGALCRASGCVYALDPERRVLAERVVLERKDAAGSVIPPGESLAGRVPKMTCLSLCSKRGILPAGGARRSRCFGTERIATG